MATSGDILLHIRADQMDLCFELATQLLSALGDAISVVDEVQGFRYFDMRNMVGFVDGTENPVGRHAVDFTIIGDEDRAFSGGSNLPDASVLAPLGLVMRKTEPRSAIAEKCFAEARKLFAAKNPI
jgi:putative iron-dependent peroxidase